MKKDKLAEFRTKNLKELVIEIAKVKKELAAKKLEKEAGKLKNVTEVKRLKKDLAQLLAIAQMLKLKGTENEKVATR